MTMPLATLPSGSSISAVMVLDLFLMLRKVFSVMPVMPSASVSELRPAIRSGRPTLAAMMRSNRRSSIGSAKFFSASYMNSAWSSASFSGYFADRSSTRLKSLRVSYSSQMSSASGRRGVDSQGARWMVRANQPSW